MAKSFFPEDMLNKSSSELTLESIAGKLSQLSESFQLLHWQTSGYAEHKATNEAYDYLRDFMDTLMEKLMGYTGRRPSVYKIEIVSPTTAMSLASDAMSFANTLKSYGESNGYHDVCNLADELSGQMAKLKYLFTLS